MKNPEPGGGRDARQDRRAPNIHTFIGCDGPYGPSRIVLFGAPFDGTVSYRPGARFASAAIRNESFGIETYSPYQDRDLSEAAVFDGGDLTLPFGNPRKVLRRVEAYVADLLAARKIPLMMGGEHLVTYAAVRAAAKVFPGLSVLCFDAHADLRDSYLGEKLSHATVMRRCWEQVGDGRLFQFGVRSGDRAEFAFARDHAALHKFGFDGLEAALRAPALADAPVYFSIDLDVLDPSAFPGTGTPEAGGVSFPALLAAAGAVLRRCHVIGLDITELSPPYDPAGISTALACKLLRELILMLTNDCFRRDAL